MLPDESYPKQLRNLLASTINRHVDVFEGSALFLAAFERSLHKEVTFEEMVNIANIKTTTGHPTEAYSDAAIREYKALCKLLNRGLTTKKFNVDELRKAINSFAEKLCVIPKKKEIQQETTDSLVGSENLYNSLEITAENIFKVAKKRRLIDMVNGNVAEESLRKCKGMMEVRTWSPGDSDGKPGQDYCSLEDGVRRNMEAMYRQYTIKLAYIIDHVEEPGVQHKSFVMMEKLISTMVKKSAVSKKAEKAIEKLLEHARAAGNGTEDRIKKAIKSQNSGTYENLDQFKEELYELKKFCDSNDKKLPKDNLSDVLTVLDKLIISEENFGEHAQRIEFRQNAKVFRQVAARVNKIIADGGSIGLVEQRQATEAVAEGIIANGTYDRVRKFLDKNEGGPITAQDEEDFYFVDTIKKLQIVANNPEAFKSILIAECGEIEDSLKKQGASEPSEKQSISDFNDTKHLFDLLTAGRTNVKKARELVKVTPLFEYSSQIKSLPKFVTSLIKDPVALKHFQTHGLEIMIAGSDSFKSAGSSVVMDMKEGVGGLRAICRANDIPLTLYYGVGSGLHRNIINIRHEIPFLRTTQGIEMRRPDFDMACEHLRIISNRLRHKAGKQFKKITLSKAIVDAGNSAATANAIVSETSLRVASGAREDEYMKKYDSPIFTIFVDNCVPNKVEEEYSFAARPAKRVGGSTATGPHAKRAIGYGSVFNNAGWGAPQLFTDLGDLFYAGEDGYLNRTEHTLSDAYHVYMGKNHVRDIVNRGINSLVLSSPDTGWQYVAHKYNIKIEVTRNYKDFAVIKVNGKEFKISELTAENGTARHSLHGHVGNMKGASESILTAAFLELEHQKSSRAMYQMLNYGLYAEKTIIKDGDRDKAPLAAKNFGREPADFKWEEAVSPEDLINVLSVINKTAGKRLAMGRQESLDTKATILETFRMQERQEPIGEVQKLNTYHAFALSRQLYELPPVPLLYPELTQQKVLARAV